MIGSVREVLYYLRGRNRYAAWRELAAQQRLPLEELRLRQLERLVAMLHHAYDSVPFYRTAFSKLGITPADIRSFKDFESLPVLTRQDIQEHTTELLSSAVPEHLRVKNTSGGTTGHPISFYQDMDLKAKMDVDWLLCMSFAGWSPDDMIVSIWGNPRDTTSTDVRAGLRPWLSGNIILNAYRYGQAELQAWLQVIAGYRRVFIYGYTSVVADLAEYILENGLQVNNVHGIVTSAERLYPWQRAAMSKAFNCRVHDQYGSREVPGVSMECEAGNMHFLIHSAYTEFLPLTPEQQEDLGDMEHEGPCPQRMVLTNLYNRTMPLIRYEIGDFGLPDEGVCPCGRGSPLMHMGIGRIGGSLRLPDGKRLYSTFFVRQMYGIEGVRFFQFRQTARDNVMLYVVRGAGFNEGSSRALETLHANFTQTLCPGLNLAIEYVDEVPRTAGGKHRHVVYDVESEV